MASDTPHLGGHSHLEVFGHNVSQILDTGLSVVFCLMTFSRAFNLGICLALSTAACITFSHLNYILITFL